MCPRPGRQRIFQEPGLEERQRRYPLFPRVLFVLDGTGSAGAENRIRALLAGAIPEFLGDGPLHVLLAYGDAVGAGGRHLLQRAGEVVPPGVQQREFVLEDRVIGQDRLIDTHRQLRPVSGGVVDSAVVSWTARRAGQ
ncbi:hypothetical protein [Streptomyces aureus]|uniref:hypothetical protein n=1 Tax=Streptomyces aureus TaxID=193461 RepID=UPI000562DB64|nr:hypothetical protein [Streptomyces aureus]